MEDDICWLEDFFELGHGIRAKIINKSAQNICDVAVLLSCM